MAHPNDSQDAQQQLRQVPTADQHEKQTMSPEIEQELRNLSMTIQKSKIQQSRMQNFAFEPVSLPPSQQGSRRQSRANSPSRRNDSIASSNTGPTPPLTPADSHAREGKEAAQRPSAGVRRDTDEQTPITPQKTPPATVPAKEEFRPASRPGSNTVSRATTPPNNHQPGDPHDRYARIQAQARQAEPVDPSKFAVPASAEASSKRQMSSSSSSLNDQTKSSLSPQGNYVKHGLFGGKRQHEDEKHHDSMSNLKRFFKVGGHKHSKERDIDGEPRKQSRTGTSTPPQQQAANSVPFADDHGLETRYGKFGKVLGSGAGGSVRLMKRSSDGVTFAVKQFRTRHPHESEKEYNKKVTAEFCIGSTLHHGNIIETMDIIHEHGNWFEVMEYAPYDLFAIVMTGKMSKTEVNCCTMQILAGMTYLHSMGLAHRDIKLDNIVVNEYGIMKLIDFGSAVVFRYPFEEKVVKATGIVGSDPYLAPEVYDNAKYDPQAVDIWSFAIVYCCMTLRRFPWKAPRLSDPSYKLFASPPSEGQPGPEEIRSKSSSELGAPGMTKDESVTASDIRERQQSKSSYSESTSSEKSGQSSIKGPWRLLRLLPRETRHIVGRMLDLDPSRRATLDDIYADRWVSETPCCEQESMGEVIRAPGHEHVLEPGGTSTGGK